MYLLAVLVHGIVHVSKWWTMYDPSKHKHVITQFRPQKNGKTKENKNQIRSSARKHTYFRFRRNGSDDGFIPRHNVHAFLGFYIGKRTTTQPNTEWRSQNFNRFPFIGLALASCIERNLKTHDVGICLIHVWKLKWRPGFGKLPLKWKCPSSKVLQPVPVLVPVFMYVRVEIYWTQWIFVQHF